MVVCDGGAYLCVELSVVACWCDVVVWRGGGCGGVMWWCGVVWWCDV